ncbi:MAG: hypothetical protein IPN76_02320 [Saprospiraceae bacterium]|nr:hypothetical protein [Saprospiraceae bacterium]
MNVAAATILLWLLHCLGGCKMPHSWREHYDPKSKDPYGTYLLHNLLKSYFPKDELKILKDSLGSGLDAGNFVYIGNDFWLDSVATLQLLDFVAAGNKAFIATPYLPHALLDSLSGFECGEIYHHDDAEGDDEAAEDEQVQYDTPSSLSDTVVNLNFEHPDLTDSAGYEFKFLFLRNTMPHTWAYFPEEYLCDSQTVFTTVGLLSNSQPYFVRANYGDGEFYLHTTPLAFTNLYLVEKRGLDYASKAFSHLKPGTIYWDERVFNPDGDAPPQQESPLKYVLSQPPLAWAWYLMLGMALLYLIFRAKRRQRVIPVLEKNANTSLEFIGTIGRLFFINSNHRQLAAQKMRLFLIFVRERYHLPTKELNEQFAKGLAIRSNVPEEHIHKILNLHRNISNSGFLSEDTMVDFHRLMERFYRECK